MAKNRLVERVFSIQCLGRNTNGNTVFKQPIAVKVLVQQGCGDEKNISLSVECPYNTGGHGQRCKASHPHTDKVGNGVFCPYSVDIPYATDYFFKKA